MAFKHNPIEFLNFNLETSEINSQRFYHTPQGNIYPSVTTVLKEFNRDAIEKWRNRVGEVEANRISKVASNHGNIIHSLCEKYILNQDINLQELSSIQRGTFLGLKGVLDRSLDGVVCLEQSLYSDRLRLAGRVDCIGTWDGSLAVIDFKTSAKEKREEWITNYFMQCTIYACMFYELTGIPIYDIVVLIGCDGIRYPQVFHRKVDGYLTSTLKYVKRYHESMEIMV